MSRLQRIPLPILMMFCGFVLGINAGRSWLSFFTVIGSFTLVTAFLRLREPFLRRRKMRALRPKAEAMLDAMIAMAEHPPQALEKTVIFNGSVREYDASVGYSLQMAAQDGTIHRLDTSTIRKGRMTGWINVRLSAHLDRKEIDRCDYLGLADYAPYEDWLAERLTKLRALVGDVSLYEARKQRLKAAGIDIDKAVEGHRVDPFEPPNGTH